MVKGKYIDKRKRLQEERKKQILNAAMEVFSRDGFSRADVDEIAKIAKLGKGTVYRHFKSKKGLFLSLVDKGMDELKETMLESVGKVTNPLEKIERGIRAYLCFFEKNRDFYRILIHEQSEFQERLNKRYMEGYYEHINEFGKVLKSAMRAGQIKKMDVKIMVNMLTGMINGLVYSWLINGRQESLTKKIPHVLEVCFSGIMKK